MLQAVLCKKASFCLCPRKINDLTSEWLNDELHISCDVEEDADDCWARERRGGREKKKERERRTDRQIDRPTDQQTDRDYDHWRYLIRASSLGFRWSRGLPELWSSARDSTMWSCDPSSYPCHAGINDYDVAGLQTYVKTHGWIKWTSKESNLQTKI